MSCLGKVCLAALNLGLCWMPRRAWLENEISSHRLPFYSPIFRLRPFSPSSYSLPNFCTSLLLQISVAQTLYNVWKLSAYLNRCQILDVPHSLSPAQWEFVSPGTPQRCLRAPRGVRCYLTNHRFQVMSIGKLHAEKRQEKTDWGKNSGEILRFRDH